MAAPETPRFVDDYLPALLAQASHAISAEFHAVARQNGFSVSEWRVLASLAGDMPLSIGRLAQLTLIKQPTVTRLLDRMEAAGHVERIAHASDRRMTLVRITHLGTRTVERLMGLAREHELRVLEPFGLERAEALKRMLRQMVELHARDAALDQDQESEDMPAADATLSRKARTARAKASGR